MNLIEPFDSVPVAYCPMLVFGPPGSLKTTLGFTARQALILNFDGGAHRAVQSLRSEANIADFGSWKEHIAQGGLKGDYKYPTGHAKAGQLLPYSTVVIDTIGRALDMIAVEVIAESPLKQPWAYRGNLSQAGYGEVGGRFKGWLTSVRAWGKEIVGICHQDQEKNPVTAQTEYAPDLLGKMAWKEVHKCFDLIGRIGYDGNVRFVDFSPSEISPCCKNPCQWPPFRFDGLPSQNWIADRIADAKAHMGRNAEASAAIAKIVADWSKEVQGPLTLAGYNALYAILGQNGHDMPKAAKAQVWSMFTEAAARDGFAFNAASKTFVETKP